MRYEIRSVKGRAREANHDCAGAVFDGVRGLFVVVDGTSKPGSGQLAYGFVQAVMEACQARFSQGAEDTIHSGVQQQLRSVLTDLHVPLFAKQTGTTSYLVGVASHGQLTLAYEGGCSCGFASAEGGIEWFTPPHCKANWRRDRSHRELALDPARHLITRCYRADRSPDPDFVFRSVAAGERLVFATDGFWAELTDARQGDVLAAPAIEINDVDDDVTWIDVKL
ncbi:serine/threonine protein phosphatase [Pseudomonas sp. A-B-19]|uniref:serine/threonine protein phosphatase n=1 Tax=Pseudomonas sp. A-B-19 TaxID=2832405 RepID=UPI001CBAAC7C|nr:serine/threonine protein phosphatase [Pseudomonas sp. A-B-19]